MAWDGIDRRESCPCKSVVELGAVTRGELALLREQIANMKNDLTELGLQIKECVEDMRAGAQALHDERRNFMDLDRRLSEHMDSEHERIGKTLRIMMIVVGASVAVDLIAGRGQELINIIEKLL